MANLEDEPLPPPPMASPENTGSNGSIFQFAQKEKFSEWFYRRFGGVGFIVSLSLHLFLILLALFWITNHYIDTSSQEDPDAFVTGSGGGNGGERPSNYREKSARKLRQELQAKHPKITAKSSTATLVLPEMKLDVPVSRNSISNAFGDGEASSGFGGGTGGGIGTGTGVGVGNGRNFVGQFAPQKNPWHQCLRRKNRRLSRLLREHAPLPPTSKKGNL